MKKIILCLCALCTFSAFAATATITIAPAPAAITLDPEIRAQFVKEFTARFYHAAELYKMRAFSATEKQHLEAATAKFADGVFQAFRKNGLLDTVAKIGKDPEVAKFFQQMLDSKDVDDYLSVARKFRDYLQERYPEMLKSELAADLKPSKMQFLKSVEEMPAMPKLAEKSVYTFWNAVLMPGLR